MSRVVRIVGLGVDEHADFRALAKVYAGDRKAALAIFRAGLGVLRTQLPVKAAPPAPPEPPAEVLLIDDGEGLAE